MFKDQMQQDVIMVLKFPSNSPVTHVAANTLPHLTLPAVVTITCSRLFAVNRWHNTVGEWEPLCVLANQLIAWFHLQINKKRQQKNSYTPHVTTWPCVNNITQLAVPPEPPSPAGQRSGAVATG